MSKVKDTDIQETVHAEEKPKGLTPQKGMAAMQGAGNVSADIPVSPDLPVLKPETTVPGEWKDLGIVNVPLAAIPDPDGVSSPDDFNHHISWKDAKSATLQLPQIQQEVANGKTGDDLAAEDDAAGLDWQNGKKRVYDLFYSPTDPIYLEKVGDKYSTISGRHRIFAAKKLGLETIPAYVREKLD